MCGSALLFSGHSLSGLCFPNIHEAQTSIQLPLQSRILTVLMNKWKETEKPDMKTDGKMERQEAFHKSCCQGYTLFTGIPRTELGACFRGLFELLILFSGSPCL